MTRCDHCLKAVPADSTWIILPPRSAGFQGRAVHLCDRHCLFGWVAWYNDDARDKESK